MHRYDRHFELSDFTNHDQEKLKNASLLIVGAGGLGSPLFSYLIGAGIGKITIYEPDTVSYSNLHRQTIYSTEDVGKLKSEICEAEARKKNTDCVLIAISEYFALDTVPIGFFDLIIASPDNYDARIAADQFAAKHHIPIIHGAVQEYQGYLMILESHSSLRYRDIFPTPMVKTKQSKGILGPVAGIIGSHMALKAIQILRETENISSTLWDFDLLELKTSKIALS
ncbi:HesA/MoeB/ThiF family protein [Halosquirtibacter laminarini]|uniref:HesA/MoeB/ThiF family protein n=1 Tax=Halosquirtibacter laminarini TaxID=3374600 RepID=A0AC61NIT3_9BACT|nr:HesA/MoeB/ThiF family protein [Prolixibacteraceae bacterium]